MKKTITLASLLACSLAITATAQEAMDALQLSNTELRGTARFQGMAGAFGALGGDLSTLGQNPGGLGVYRSSDLGLTMNVDFNKSTTESGSTSFNNTQTRFSVPNVGYVGSFKLDSETMPYFNIGFTYSRQKDYRRHFSGRFANLQSSMSNYMAGQTGNFTENDLGTTDNYNPYYDGNGPWGSVLFYNSYLINNNNGTWQGLMDPGTTTGYGEFEVDQWGQTDEYNISLGGNIKNTVFWGLGVGITDLDYETQIYYGEDLTNAYIYDYAANNGRIVQGNADFGITNYLRTSGTGYNFKMGVIVKPVNELRLGFAFHTPTYYDLHDFYKTVANYGMTGIGDNVYSGRAETGTDNYWDDNRYRLQTPWKFMVSAAGVIGSKGIVSADYEWQGAYTSRVKSDDGDEYTDVTESIKSYLQASHIVRVGAEYRVDNNWSLRCGYSYQTSPVKNEVQDGLVQVYTPSTNPSFEYDRSVQHITAGFGYRWKNFYWDMAYVYKQRKTQFNAFSAVPYTGGIEPGENCEVKDNNHRAVMTLGFRF